MPRDVQDVQRPASLRGVERTQGVVSLGAAQDVLFEGLRDFRGVSAGFRERDHLPHDAADGLDGHVRQLLDEGRIGVLLEPVERLHDVRVSIVDAFPPVALLSDA